MKSIPTCSTATKQKTRTGDSASENRSAILRELSDKGVLFRLTAEGRLQYRDPKNVLSEEEVAGLDICRDGLTEQYRFEQRVCRDCPQRRTQNTPYCRDCLWKRVGDHYYKYKGKPPTGATVVEQKTYVARAGEKQEDA